MKRSRPSKGPVAAATNEESGPEVARSPSHQVVRRLEAQVHTQQ